MKYIYIYIYENLQDQVIHSRLNGFLTQLALTYLPPSAARVDADALEPGEPLVAHAVRHARFRPCSLPPVLPARLPLRFAALVSRSAAATKGDE
jgi:hypothetical protein